MTESQGTMRIYVGTYTRREPHADGKSKGIHILRFDSTDGSLASEGVIGGIENPSYLALHPEGTALYAISEVAEFEGKPAGFVSAYALDEDGSAQLLNQRSTKGAGPAYITIDKWGKNVLVANYGGGSVAVLPIQGDLSLGTASAFLQHEGGSVNPQRQEGPHAHSIVLDGANRYALAADLGTDKVMIYRYDADDGSLVANADQPWARAKSGAGPRHISFHPSRPFVYVINELDSTITAYRYGAEKGAMSEIQNVSTLPDGFDGRNHTADIHVHPSGQFVYGSNRGHDSVAVFAVDEDTGELSLVSITPSGGEVPRGFLLDPTGQWAVVANQNTDNVVVFAINPQTGELSPVGVEVDVPTPVCLRMLA